MNKQKDNFLGVDFIFDRVEIKSFISSCQTGYICLVNANIVSQCETDQSYKKVIGSSIFNVCDGSVIAKLFNKIKKRNISSYPGPDLFIEHVKLKNFKHAFIGSSDDVLESLKNRLAVLNPDIEESLFYSPPFVSNVNDFNYSKIASLINKYKPDIIWVSLGAPKQEFFMNKIQDHVDGGIMIGVGAAFLFSSGYGNNIRAPKWMLDRNLECLFRLATEPVKTSKRLINEIIWLTKLLIIELKQ